MTEVDAFAKWPSIFNSYITTSNTRVKRDFMEPLNLEATENTPEVEFDPTSGLLKIKGRSIPENAAKFYYPILDWLKVYTETPSSKTRLDLYLEYINSISQKMVLEIFLIVQELKKNHKSVEVNWYYDEDDEEMMEEGQLFSKRFSLDVNVKPVKIG